MVQERGGGPRGGQRVINLKEQQRVMVQERGGGPRGGQRVINLIEGVAKGYGAGMWWTEGYEQFKEWQRVMVQGYGQTEGYEQGVAKG